MNVFVNPVQIAAGDSECSEICQRRVGPLVFNRLTVLRYKVEFRNEIKNSEI